jgi:hypothetical protein
MKLIKFDCGALILALLASFVSDIVAAPVGTAFTYQGRLKSAGQPASGNYDLRFALYDAASGNGLIGSPLTNSPVTVTNGNFTALLDFGAVFAGDARWLEIGVRTNGSSDPFAISSARQQLTPSPYALNASSAGLAATATTAGTATNLSGNLSGDVTGTQVATVVGWVGGQTATDVAAGTVAAIGAATANMPDRIVKRDALGNFAASAITAASFTGSGAALTGLDADSLATGTLADGRLSGNVALLNANQTFSGSNLFAGVSTLTNANNSFAGSLSGNGGGLTSLNASQLTSGTVPSDRLSGTYSGALTLNNSGNSFAGDGSALAALNAGNLASGTLPAARLSGNYPNALTLGNAGNSFTGNGSGLVNLNASALASGTVPGTQLSGIYSSPVTFNNAGNSFSGNGAGLTSLNAGSLASGAVPSAQLSGTYSSPVTFNNGANSFSGNGAGLTSLNASSLASGAVPSAQLSGTYSSPVNFNNAGNSFSGNGSGLTSVGLLGMTVLSVDCSGSGVAYSTAFTKVADIGSFTKQVANSTIELTFNGRTYSTFSFGVAGAIFELRVDNTATSNGRARASYRESSVAVQTSITGVFTGLAAGNHTVSMWVQGVGGGGTGAQLDQGCWNTDHVVVKELK